jgi:hypothetical protein
MRAAGASLRVPATFQRTTRMITRHPMRSSAASTRDALVVLQPPTAQAALAENVSPPQGSSTTSNTRLTMSSAVTSSVAARDLIELYSYPLIGYLLSAVSSARRNAESIKNGAFSDVLHADKILI